MYYPCVKVRLRPRSSDKFLSAQRKALEDSYAKDLRPGCMFDPVMRNLLAESWARSSLKRAGANKRCVTPRWRALCRSPVYRCPMTDSRAFAPNRPAHPPAASPTDPYSHPLVAFHASTRGGGCGGTVVVVGGLVGVVARRCRAGDVRTVSQC